MSNHPIISSQELDKIFDEGEEDILEYLDFSKARRPGLEASKISENYQETIESSKGNSLIINITMLGLMVSCIVVIYKFLDSDLDNEENLKDSLKSAQDMISTDPDLSKKSKKAESSEKKKSGTNKV